MTALADACADLAAALPRAEALIAMPDADGSSGRGQPSSRFPGNNAAFNALMDALEGLIRLEQTWHSDAAGRPVPRRPMRMTGAALASLLRLAHAQPDTEQRHAITLLIRWTTPVYQLAAVDLDERAIRIIAACPYCHHPELLIWMRQGKLACPRGPSTVCEDGDGNPPRGQMGYSRLDGTPQIEWADGLVT